MDLETLQGIRSKYERKFGEDADIRSLETILSERDLELSGHVFVASDSNRVFQITVDEDVIPCAFFKSVGVDDEKMLLQIAISSDDLKETECRQLFLEWMVNRTSEYNLEGMVAEFK